MKQPINPQPFWYNPLKKPTASRFNLPIKERLYAFLLSWLCRGDDTLVCSKPSQLAFNKNVKDRKGCVKILCTPLDLRMYIQNISYYFSLFVWRTIDLMLQLYSKQGGRGTFGCYYTSPQSFINTFSYSLI